MRVESGSVMFTIDQSQVLLDQFPLSRPKIWRKTVTSSWRIVIDFSNHIGGQQDILLDNAVGCSDACMLCQSFLARNHSALTTTTIPHCHQFICRCGCYLQLMITVKIDMYSCSMHLINIKVFLKREGLIREGKQVDCWSKVLEFSDDEVT